jgi:Flp pilus assembly protein TadG
MRKNMMKDVAGNVFIIVAFSAMAILGSAGVAVDIGRSQMVQAKLQNAVDAAGLAAGATLNTEDLTAVATKYINLNFSQGNLGATLKSVNAVLSADKKVLTVTATATLPTSIMKLFDKNLVTLQAKTEVTRSNKGLEVALVLDTTGSMADNGKLAALKTASHDLLNILFGSNAVGENLWIGIVPFSMSVNINPSRTNWLNAAQYAALNWYATSWGGCVEARYTTGRDITDDPPFDLALPNVAVPAVPYERFRAYYAPPAIWNSSGSVTPNAVNICNNNANCTCALRGPCSVWTATSANVAVYITCSGNGNNRSCERTTRTYAINPETGPNAYCPSAVTPLTNVKATLEAGINALVARGGTYINYGAVWGWRMISPRWRGYWGGVMNANNLPLNYHAPLMSKAVIIMTDGMNSPSSYSAYSNSATANTTAKLDAKTTAVCNAMKAQGVIVYTVLLQETNAGVKTLLRNCATTPDYFFDSPTNAALQTAFQTIGDSLANLRISR